MVWGRFLGRLALGFASGAICITIERSAQADGRALFILDASGSMRAKAADGRTRFEHAKDQIKEQASQLATRNAQMGMYVFSHRSGGCDDVELKLPLGASKSGITDSLSSLHPKGWTPLAKTIEIATQYIKDNHLEGTELIIVSDGGDSCGGDPVGAARALYAQCHSKISVIGMDVTGDAVGQMEGVARAGNGSFRREFTGTETDDPAPAPKPGREGAPDDSAPILDPNTVPKEVTFEQAPAAISPQPASQPANAQVLAPRPPASPPPPPASQPKATDSPLELMGTTPFLL